MALGYSAFVTPNGNLAPAFANGKFTATFNNTATFTCASTETCAAGEYRQNVRGSISVDGSPLTFVLCSATGATLSNVFQQDACSPPTCTAYGYRACAASNLDQYTPTQATGCSYAMHDEPGFHAVTAGRTYTLAVTFQGLLVNTTTSATLATQTWTVNGTGVAPALASAPASGAAAQLSVEDSQVGDKVLWVDHTQNLISKAREVHVVIHRSPGAARPSDGGLRAVLRDENGADVATVGEPAVHEFGNKRGTTVSIVYTLASNAPLPKTVLLTKTAAGWGADEPLLMPVKAR